MFSTKIRTAMLALVATFSFAVSVAPSAQAETKTSKQSHADQCYEMAMAIQRNRAAYYAAKNAKDPDPFEVQEALHIWNESIDRYEKNCVAQSRRVLPAHVSTPLTAAGNVLS